MPPVVQGICYLVKVMYGLESYPVCRLEFGELFNDNITLVYEQHLLSANRNIKVA